MEQINKNKPVDQLGTINENKQPRRISLKVNPLEINTDCADSSKLNALPVKETLFFPGYHTVTSICKGKKFENALEIFNSVIFREKKIYSEKVLDWANG